MTADKASGSLFHPRPFRIEMAAPLSPALSGQDILGTVGIIPRAEKRGATIHRGRTHSSECPYRRDVLRNTTRTSLAQILALLFGVAL